MQSLSVKKGFLNSVVEVPSSKSYANRALIISSLKKNQITLSRMPTATDVTILIECLKKAGLDIQSAGDSVTISNSFPECEKQGGELEVGEGGTTARFLAALLLRGKETYVLNLGSRLKERPWKEFIDQVNALGGKAVLTGNRLTLKGPLNYPPILEIDCSKTTQFATAFQLTVPSTTIIKPLHLTSSLSYWRMTEKIITDLCHDQYAIPLDWSSASYPLSFAALNQKINFPGLKYDEYQADAKFLGILKKFSSVQESSTGLEVAPANLTGNLSFDVSDALDLVPTLAFFLSHISGKHELYGIENLVHKESDRLAEVIKLMKLFERSAEVQGSILVIEGSSHLVENEVQLVLPDDHRMVMVGTLFLLHHRGGSVKPAEAVNKSYPGFFNLIKEQK